ncbi:MAG: O-antigen ligase family protein [Chloroflexota bacterium]
MRPGASRAGSEAVWASIAPGLFGGTIWALAPWPAAALGPVLIAAGAFASPLGGLLVIVATLPFSDWAARHAAVGIPLTELAFVAAATGALARHGRSDWGATFRAGVERARGPHVAPILLLLAAAALSLLATEYPRLSLRMLRTVVVEPVAFYYFARLTLTTPQRGQLAATALVAGVTIACAWALIAYASAGTTIAGQIDPRARGPFQSPNNLSLVIGRALPMALALALVGGTTSRGAASAAGAAIQCAALLASRSVGGWLSVAVSTVAFIGQVATRRTTVAAIAALALAAVAASLSPWVRTRMDPTTGTSLARVQLWTVGVEMLRDHPILGIGLDNFLYRYPAYFAPGTAFEPNLSHPHNVVLDAWLSLGLLGPVAFGWLILAFFRQAAKQDVSSDRGNRDYLRAAVVASMVDFIVHGLLDNSYFVAELAYIFWLTLALPDAIRAPEQDETRVPD